MILRSLYLILLSVLAFNQVNAQTCCSAGAPVNSSLNISSNEEKPFGLQLNYEYKSINLLVDNNKRLTNDPRTRSGQNLSIKLDYSLNSKLSFSAYVPMVHQSRSTFSEEQNSLGLGDLTLLAQYILINNEGNVIDVGGGIKLPTGKVNHRSDSNIFFSPDMQSGSGSIDYFLKTSYTRNNFLINFLGINVSGHYRFNTQNKSFAKTDNFEGRKFGFGDERQIQISLNYLLTYSFGFVTPDIAVRYRNTKANLEQSTNSPNSGGQWISLPIGFTLSPNANNSFRIYSELPLSQSLNGLQISTNFTIGIQAQFNFKNKKDKNKFPQ